ncbi:MAG TPA: EamA family transporter [Kofleriaceae bacterium]|nr:EamA family transporter [Kofleriaceae bacterium]
MTVVLVLVSAFFHALWNALLRVEPDKDRGLVAAIAFASLFACVIAGIRWQLGQTPFETLESVWWTLLAGAFEAVYFATLARALEIGPLGAVYTISRGGAVLVVWPMSIWLFHEVVTATSASGSALVLLGLVLCGVGARGVAGTGDRRGVWWAAACAASVAGYHLSYKAALLTGAGSSATFAVSLSLSALISIVRVDRTGLGALLRVRWHRIALMGIVCGGSFLILMEALAMGGSGYVLTLRNTSVLFAALLAYFIGEKPAHAELVGAALVAAGAVLMAW